MLHKYIIDSSDGDAFGLLSPWNTDLVTHTSRLSVWADWGLLASTMCAPLLSYQLLKASMYRKTRVFLLLIGMDLYIQMLLRKVKDIED